MAPMKLLSVNVGLPREIRMAGKTCPYFNLQVASVGQCSSQDVKLGGRRAVQISLCTADSIRLVYAYPSEHYRFWREEVPGIDLPLGVFGENFTTEGLLEEAVRIGDRVRVGSAQFVITQPRLPCFKLGIRFGRPEMVKRFLRAVGLDSILPSWKRDRLPLATR